MQIFSENAQKTDLFLSASSQMTSQDLWQRSLKVQLVCRGSPSQNGSKQHPAVIGQVVKALRNLGLENHDGVVREKRQFSVLLANICSHFAKNKTV